MADKGETLLNISERNAVWNKLALQISREHLSIVSKTEPRKKESAENQEKPIPEKK
jgi:hypothetical protein